MRSADIPPYILPGPIRILQHAGHGLGHPVGLALSITLRDHRPRPARRRAHRRRALDHVHAVEMARAVALSLRHHPAGDADRGDRAADHHLGQQHACCAADLRLDRRLLPDPVQHHPRAATRPTTIWSTCSSSMAPAAGRRLRYLRLPAALPYFLGGLRISGGLALIGAVVAEFVAGSGGTGLGPRLPASSRRAISSRSRACSPPSSWSR